MIKLKYNNLRTASERIIDNLSEEDLINNINYISMKQERDYWRSMSSSFRNILEQEKEQARLEVASAIYEQLQEHGATYVKKWIKEHYTIKE